MISFVIPCYNSELTIEGVTSEIQEAMLLRPTYNYEIICINDCSPDNVLSQLKMLVKEFNNITVIDLAKNSGKHAAVMAGYSVVAGDYIVNLDDDGQCPMDRLWDLIDELNKGYDFVTANYVKKKQSAFKNFGSWVNNIMSAFLLGKPKWLRFENFSAMRRFLLDTMLQYKNPYPYLEGLVLSATRNIGMVLMEERERTVGTGNFTFKKSFSLWLNGFTAFSVKPLRLASFLGLIISLIGFLSAIILVIRKIFIVPEMQMGYPSTIVIVLFIGGIIMAMLGLLGEYVGRIYISINNSPQYVIRKVYNSNILVENTEEKSL
jgi:undecaprenyl-phosphate 4-deoxy-4-formamido-L-arabinose transferase